MPDRQRSRCGSISHTPGRPQFQPQNARRSGERKVDDRDILERFLIVCEGEKTEPNYFRAFRVPGRVVDVEGTGYNTLSLVDEAIRLRAASPPPYDQVWCVFDRDSFEADQFNSAIRKAEAAGLQVAWTNEAFELWYLLHFDDHRAALSRTQYAEKLRDRLGHGYAKNSQTMHLELESRQEQALHRAEHLWAALEPGCTPQQANPCTTVHLLVQALRANITPQKTTL